MTDIAKLSIDVDSAQALKASDSLNALTESADEATKATDRLKKETDRNTVATQKAAKEKTRARNAVERITASLEREEAIIGKTKAEIKLYDLAQAGATKEDLEAARAKLQLIEKLKKQQVAVDNTKDSTVVAGGAVGGLGRKAGAAGIQIQQLVGQIQGGQNATQALAAQAADLGIVLGAPLVGVIVALGAAVAGPLIAGFLGAGKSAKELKEEVKALEDGFDSLLEKQKAYAITVKTEQLDEQRERFEKIAKEIAAVEKKLELADKGQLKFGGRRVSGSRLTEAVKEFNSELDELNFNLGDAEKQIAEFEQQIKDIKDPPSKDKSKPFWGSDEAVEKEAAAIRMANMIAESKERQRIIEEGQAFGQMMFQRDLMLKEEAKAASDQALLDRELEFRNQMTAIYARSQEIETAIRKEAIAEQQEAAIIAETNKQKMLMALSSAFSTFMQSENKALFEMGKIGSAGKAIYDAYGSINATLAQGGAFAWPAAIATGIAAMANVNKIMNTKYGDTSGSVSSAAPALSAPTDNSTTQNVQITVNAPNGDGGSIAAAIQDLFDSGRMRIQGGGVVSV